MMVTNEITISVIITTCDRPEYIQESLKSVLDQEVAPFEILIIDNGFISLKKENLPSCEYLHVLRTLPRIGVSQARNIGATIASGDYIAFLDDDDSWDKGYLKHVYELIISSKPDIIVGCIENMQTMISLKGKDNLFKSKNDYISTLLVRNPGTIGSNVVVKKSALTESSGYDPYLITGEDKGLVLDLLLLDKSIAFSKKAIVYYRCHNAGERLSSSRKLVVGRMRFFWKYKKEMKLKEKVLNLMLTLNLFLKISSNDK
ncbi:glycosyltransferase family 2 protein [Aidingimonas halophila]|uniref:Glycosyltransferase, GT2 family n=1 Tax=Aidingimonas halophila TaxID=574349 RepID=A0A1H3CGF9_9GAMM|nr:glycosyltransferase family 2 protein [Aidingimonas halophila]GHC35531.1 hypothetical protein GCM10008094_30930 [Aidingimonas halophila]SDX52998.1 Glycosyltransferase, GT2 family [Aidingimonas halophila]